MDTYWVAHVSKQNRHYFVAQRATIDFYRLSDMHFCILDCVHLGVKYCTNLPTAEGLRFEIRAFLYNLYLQICIHMSICHMVVCV